MKRLTSVAFGFALVLASGFVYTPAYPQTTIVESGKIRYYETHQIRGEETYQIERSADGELTLHVKTDLPFVGEDKKTLVNATLRTSKYFSPRSFTIKGTTLLELEEDASITFEGRTANVQVGLEKLSADAPHSFPMTGTLPVTVETMLVRYWLTHGFHSSIRLVPAGEPLIEFRGKDKLKIAGKTVELNRYQFSVRNWRAGWGRQTLWLDREHRFVAAVNLGSELETNLYAFRDGYESFNSFFLKRAADDAIDRLTQLANQLSPATQARLALVGGTLIDVNGKPSTPNAVVLIEGDRIVAAGPRSTIKIPNGAKVVDVTGKFLLPGLWDMHAHLFQAELGPTYLAAGITTARDVGNDIEFATALRDAAKEKRGLGPRLLLAGYIDGKNEDHTFDVQVETP